MLIQETGLQRELNLDEMARRIPESEGGSARTQSRGVIYQGSGAIEWLWNTNSYMTESNETPIGADPAGRHREAGSNGHARHYAEFAKSLE